MLLLLYNSMNIQLKVPKPISDNMYEKMTFAIPNFESRCVGILSISRKIFIVRDISTSIKNHKIIILSHIMLYFTCESIFFFKSNLLKKPISSQQYCFWYPKSKNSPLFIQASLVAGTLGYLPMYNKH